MGRIKVEDYGDVLAVRYDGEKLFYSEEGGNYQGEYVAVVKCKSRYGYGDHKIEQYYVFSDSFGSCSGCDWIEGETDYDGTVDAAKALQYAEQTSPLFILENEPTQAWVDELARKMNA